MKNIKNILLACVSLITILTACTKDEDVKPLPSYADFLSSNPDVSIFNAALERGGLQTYKNGGGPFTFIMPINSAFQSVGINLDSVNRMTQGVASYLVTYHIINARFSTNDMIAAYTFPRNTAQLTPIYSGGDESGGFFINGAKISSANNEIANGLIHKIATPLSPVNLIGNIQTILTSTGKHSLFIAALTKANRWALFATTTAYTVIAPTDSAMIASGLTSGTIASATMGRVDTIVRYHYFNSLRLFTNDLGNKITPQTALGVGRTLTASNNGRALKGRTNAVPINITTANLLGNNGVVQIVDGVLRF